MKINVLEMEWNDEGCVAKASGFKGLYLSCPRYQERLMDGVEHRCGGKFRMNTGNPRVDSMKVKTKRITTGEGKKK